MHTHSSCSRSTALQSRNTEISTFVPALYFIYILACWKSEWKQENICRSVISRDVLHHNIHDNTSVNVYPVKKEQQHISAELRHSNTVTNTNTETLELQSILEHPYLVTHTSLKQTASENNFMKLHRGMSDLSLLTCVSFCVCFLSIQGCHVKSDHFSWALDFCFGCNIHCCESDCWQFIDNLWWKLISALNSSILCRISSISF